MYRGCELSLAEKDLMSEFVYVSIGRVCTMQGWGKQTIPQGVSVFMKHSESLEYMFTKDSKYEGQVDYRCEDWNINEVERYIPTHYTGMVLYMNRDALSTVSKHRKHPY